MKFDIEAKVIVETLNREEARAFVKFLKSEILRHQVDIQQAEDLMIHVCSKFGIGVEL